MTTRGMNAPASAITDQTKSSRAFTWAFILFMCAVSTSGDTRVTASGEEFSNYTQTPLPSPINLVEDAIRMAGIFTCKTQCKKRFPGEVKAPERLPEILFDKLPCYCDEECTTFGDCCADALEADTSPSDRPEQFSNHSIVLATHSPGQIIQPVNTLKVFMGIPSHRWGCHELNLPRNESKEWAYLVNSCPVDYEDTEIITMCSRRQRIPAEEYSYILDLPVISSMTGIPYLNSFCMACNEEDMSESESPFYPMTLNYFCHNLTSEMYLDQTSVYVRGHRNWIKEGKNCTLEIVDSKKLFFGAGEDLERNSRPGNYTRRCMPTIDTCEDETLGELCSMYALYVKAETSRGPKVYKNPHCALCNGRRQNELQCALGPIRRSFGRGKYRLPKLDNIFQIKWNGGRKGCPPLHIWDVVEEKCVAVRCKGGQVYSRGRCETSEAYPWNSTSDGGNSSGSDPGYSAEGGNETAGEESSSSMVDLHANIQGYLMLACMSISVLCLNLHVIIYCLLSKRRNLPGRNLLALSLALLLAQSSVLLSGINIDDYWVGYWVCVTAAVVIHYFYLSGVFWMNVMSVDVWRTFSSSSSRHHQVGGRDSQKRLHLRYSAYAWGMPFLLTALSVAIDMVPATPDSTLWQVQPNYGLTQQGMCWLSNSVGAAIFFSIPTIVLLLANAGLFARSVFKIHENQESRRYMRRKAMEEEALCSQRVSKATESEFTSTTAEVSGMLLRRPFRRPESTTSCISGKDKSRLYLYVKLATIMGLSWICGFVAALTDLKELWYPFIVLNGLQGAFIFFMFDVKWKIMGLLAERFTGRKPEWSTSSSSSSKWPILRRTMSWGRKARNRKSSEYADEPGNFPSRGKKRESSSRTTSSSLPNSDMEICNLPGGPNTVLFSSHPADLKIMENQQVLEHL